jgi:hypothetical protein
MSAYGARAPAPLCPRHLSFLPPHVHRDAPPSVCHG